MSLTPKQPSQNDRLARIEARLRRLETRRSLPNASIGEGGLEIKNGGEILLEGGDIIAQGGNVLSGDFVHGSTGWRLQPNGNVEFNDITLRGGIIGDDALTNPLSPYVAHAQADSFSLTTSIAEKARVTIPVPSGFTRALVVGAIMGGARNTNTVQDFLDGAVDINGVTHGWDATIDGSPGFLVGIAHTATALLTSLGSSFYVRGMLRSGLANWSADPWNAVNVDALVLFLR